MIIILRNIETPPIKLCIFLAMEESATKKLNVFFFLYFNRKTRNFYDKLQRLVAAS